MGCGASSQAQVQPDYLPEDPLSAKEATPENRRNPPAAAPSAGKSGGGRREMSRSNTSAIAPGPRSVSISSDKPSEPKVFRQRSQSVQPMSQQKLLEMNGRGGAEKSASPKTPDRSPDGQRKHRGRSNSMLEADKPIVRFTAYVQAGGDDGLGPGKKKARGVITGAPETELDLRQRLQSLQGNTDLTKAEAEMLLSVLRKHFLFTRMAPAQLEKCVSNCERVRYPYSSSSTSSSTAAASTQQPHPTLKHPNLPPSLLLCTHTLYRSLSRRERPA